MTCRTCEGRDWIIPRHTFVPARPHCAASCCEASGCDGDHTTKEETS